MADFNRVLIANRGAIACRIIRTLDRLGIQSVAVFAESDRESLHVPQATFAESLGEGGATDTYLNIEKLLQIARDNACDAVHPGYGFLSENSSFVEQLEKSGLTFIGPTASQINQFGQKHIARKLALDADVPLPPGSGLLDSAREAIGIANDIGYPVMLKSTAGGGGIGMQLCHTDTDLDTAFSVVKRLSGSHFANDGVFLEKAIDQARHIEVQVFGDGEGQAVSLGERDCSAQRRNQKVIEECPAPDLTNDLRQELHATAERLMRQVSYRNAGTVEFILDVDSQKYYFLEVNTRLQVEHGVTEAVYDVDLVEWMVKQAAGTLDALELLKRDLTPHGHAVQVRVYAEDPYQNFQPGPGPLTRVSFPETDNVRIDHWIESGVTVPPDFDPLLAKVIVKAESRSGAIRELRSALQQCELYGGVTNLDYLQKLLLDDVVTQGKVTTRYLNRFDYRASRIDVLRGGTMTTIQDRPGRMGYWSIGIPPSGPFDFLSFDIGNRLLGNHTDSAGLEVTLDGPELLFSVDRRVVVTGGRVPVEIDGVSHSQWTVIAVKAGQRLSIGKLHTQGARAYLCVEGGIDCPHYLGSRSTFTLGEFGGHNGNSLKKGDVLQLPELPDHEYGQNSADMEAEHRDPIADDLPSLPTEWQPTISNRWTIRVVYGPHGAPDFFTDSDVDMLFGTDWDVHYNTSRTGVRLIGPVPSWARNDGGEAGLHPSNIHDNAYAFGSIDFTGDMPVILGPDGPSLGGFVCPATVISADLWMLGQLRAGDHVRFNSVSLEDAQQASLQQAEYLASVSAHVSAHVSAPVSDQARSVDKQFDVKQTLAAPTALSKNSSATVCDPLVWLKTASRNAISCDASPVVARYAGKQFEVVYRVAGDQFLLIEYGEQRLDLTLRFRVHAVMSWLEHNSCEGIRELTPGIRSLQVRYDSHRLTLTDLLDHLYRAEQTLDSADKIDLVPSRIVHLPLSWDDEACQLAIEKYHQSVRKNAPWYPSNLEFIRRINGLESIADVKQLVFDASYLVMGLGDVYLGAPVATPINPKHRLVTTKYNPARTWTAENSVGIGGAYLCIYGMEGPGGYQFIGRTLQMWNRYRSSAAFDKPWLLRFFDQIRFFEVSQDELLTIRKDFPLGRYPLQIEHTSFSLTEYQRMVEEQQHDIDTFNTCRNAAFDQELEHWRASGQFNPAVEIPDVVDVSDDWPDNCIVIESPVAGSIWQCNVEAGQSVTEGQTLMILESMKMEIDVDAPEAMTVHRVLIDAGQQVSAGQPLVVMETANV